MRVRSAGPRPGERSNVEAPSLAQVVVKKARREICAGRVENRNLSRIQSTKMKIDEHKYTCKSVCGDAN